MLPGKGDGTFGPALITLQQVVSSCLSTGVLQTADLNQDGHPDLVFLTYSGASPVVPSAVVLLNNGDGTFNSSTAFDLPDNEYAVGVAVADFNRDGTPDLAVITQVLSGFGPHRRCRFIVYIGLGKSGRHFFRARPRVRAERQSKLRGSRRFQS